MSTDTASTLAEYKLLSVVESLTTPSTDLPSRLLLASSFALTLTTTFKFLSNTGMRGLLGSTPVLDNLLIWPKPVKLTVIALPAVGALALPKTPATAVPPLPTTVLPVALVSEL